MKLSKPEKSWENHCAEKENLKAKNESEENKLNLLTPLGASWCYTESMPLVVLILNAVADVLLNLAAGWFGIVLIVPFTFQAIGKRPKPIILLLNAFFGIVALSVAVLIQYFMSIQT